MFRPKKMQKVRVLVLKSAVERLVKDLHEAGLVDITRAKHAGLEEGRPLHSFDAVSAELLKLRALWTIMEAATEKKESGEAQLLPGKEAMDASRNLAVAERLRLLSQENSQLEEQLRTLESESAVMKKLAPYKGVDFSRLATRKLGYRVGEMPAAKLAGMREKLDRIGENSIAARQTPEGPSTVLVLYDNSNETAVDSALADSGFTPFELHPQATTSEATLARINSELVDRTARLKDVKKELKLLSDNNRKLVRNLLRSLEVEAERAEIAERFASSRLIYVVQGWIIAGDYAKLAGMLKKYGSEAMLEDAGFGHDEMPPTVLDNPQAASPFEFLTNTYSLPNYFELDPTMAYFIALPILYGMIVGDVLYGAMSLVISFWLLKKFSKSYIMSNVSRIWMYSAIPTMVFGVIFDEWGGMSHYHLLEVIGKWLGTEILHAPLYTGFTRIENVVMLVAVTAGVGLLHLAIGFALGAVNEWNHNRKHAMAKLAWIGVELGALVSLLAGINIISAALLPVGLGLLLVCIIVIGSAEGILGIIELPGLLGNVLSYTRIAAVGIAGIVIAELVNEFIMPLPTQGLLALVMFPIFIVLHVVNCFVAMFESIVQGGRLNIVEFRSKFLHGGGGVFTPFALYSRKL